MIHQAKTYDGSEVERHGADVKGVPTSQNRSCPFHSELSKLSAIFMQALPPFIVHLFSQADHTNTTHH
jgi:hypothetical protein